MIKILQVKSTSPTLETHVQSELKLCLIGGQGIHLQQVFLTETVILSNVPAQNSHPETGYPTDPAITANEALWRQRELWQERGPRPNIPARPSLASGSPSPVTSSEGSRCADTCPAREGKAAGSPLMATLQGQGRTESQGI